MIRIKNVKLKTALFRLYDILFSPLTFISALQMWIVRRYGIQNFPIARQLLLKRGIFPIQRHYYEPLFHPDDLTQSLDAERNLPGIRFEPEEQLRLLLAFQFNDEIVQLFGDDKITPVGTHQFTSKNNSFRCGDIELYYNLIRHFKPSKIVEIGSGNSTMVALLAIQENETKNPDYHGSITAIEPYPWFKHEKLHLMPSRLEEVDRAIFSQLGANDILFIDSSHMIRPQGEVLLEFLEILPCLAPGVIVHVHDTFTPRDYLKLWVIEEHRFWNEQYLLEAFLSFNDQFKVLIAPNYLQLHHPNELNHCCPLLAKSPGTPVHSFWMQRRL